MLDARMADLSSFLRASLVCTALASISFTTTGCVLLNWDRRSAVARQLLLDGDGHFDEAVTAAAVEARFPPGTAVSEIVRFVAESKGKCNPTGADLETLWCEIPLRGGFCWAALLGLRIHYQGDVTTEIETVVGGLGC